MTKQWQSMFAKTANSTESISPVRDILETFVPGYKGLFIILDQALGLDVSLVISGCAVIFAMLKFWSFLQEQIYVFAKATVLSEIAFDSDDEIYVWLMEWLKKQPLAGRTLIAKAGLNPEMNWRTSSKKKTLREPPEISYEPSMGTHYFWFERKLYRFSQWVPRNGGDNMWVPGRKHVDASLSCIGRSAAPIRRLMAAAAMEHFEKMSSKTPIYRPYPKSVRQNARGYWSEVTSRPSRSMDTVVFDVEQKKRLIEDMDEYLLPETMSWYADHGIPYRRGYLFYGPPGTGKSSLCFALAGHFRLPLYCLSLQEPSMTEEDLAALFDALPRQCIAVLEDVDCAGLVVRNPDEKDKEKSGPVSLSGLLNIIDGVASKEGRVLIMTTNRIEALDAALIRPGRVDQQIEFKSASREDARKLFEGMYDEKDSVLSLQFAKQVPDHVLSAAEIQGFLLIRKGRPEVAIQDAGKWVKDTLVAKDEATRKEQANKEEAAKKQLKTESKDTSKSSITDTSTESSKESEPVSESKVTKEDGKLSDGEKK